MLQWSKRRERAKPWFACVLQVRGGANPSNHARKESPKRTEGTYSVAASPAYNAIFFKQHLQVNLHTSFFEGAMRCQGGPFTLLQFSSTPTYQRIQAKRNKVYNDSLLRSSWSWRPRKSFGVDGVVKLAPAAAVPLPICWALVCRLKAGFFPFGEGCLSSELSI